MRSLAATTALAIMMVLPAGAAGPEGKASVDWHMNTTVIEACSCTMFCPCYFNTKPEGHHDHGSGAMKHYCRANNAYKINKGNYGKVKLDGAKFWIATDLGSEFEDGVMDWAVLYFDKATSKEQREAIQTIVGHLFPVKWNSFTTAEGDISWKHEGDTAHALLDGGKSGEVKLASKVLRNSASEPVVIKNLKYWGAPRNDGFVLMPNEVEAYRVGEKAFEFKGTNGFMLTLDIDSKSVAAAGQ